MSVTPELMKMLKGEGNLPSDDPTELRPLLAALSGWGPQFGEDRARRVKELGPPRDGLLWFRDRRNFLLDVEEYCWAAVGRGLALVFIRGIVDATRTVVQCYRVVPVGQVEHDTAGRERADRRLEQAVVKALASFRKSDREWGLRLLPRVRRGTRGRE